MSRRPGEWNLLDHDHDPVEADVPAIDSRLAHYRELADMMEAEGQRLKQIADRQALAGRYADELREAAGEVAGDLRTVVGRYHAVVEAITGYLPALETALTGSAAALDDAVTAHHALGQADATPRLTAAEGTSLTPVQQAANDAKDSAHASATGDLDAAKARLSQVLSVLDEAGQRAASTVRGGFGDGLTDSGWDRFTYRFMSFLKVFVQVLTYIGIALAAVALIIPGVGAAILAAVVTAVAVVEVAAQAVLAATGNGSWTDLALAVVGLVTLGAGKGLGALGKLVPGKTPLGSGAGRDAGGGARGSGRPDAPEATSIPWVDRFCKSDPIDVATGENVLPQIDLALPVPLVRTHVSSYRAGGLFGPSWASTLDQRVEVDDEGACYFAPDGMVLVYPAVPAGTSALPVAGPRWPLTLHPDGSAELVDPQGGRTTNFTGALIGPARVTSVTEASGGQLNVEHDENGLPVAARGGDGTVVAIKCDEGRVLALHQLDDEGRRSILIAGFTYNQAGYLVAVTNDSGRSLRFSYDDEARLSSWRDRNGYSYLYSYDNDGRCVRTWGERGHLNSTFTYADADADAAPGSVTTHTDSFGHRWIYRFDEARHLIQMTDPLGATTSWSWEGPHLASRVDALDRCTRYERDDVGGLLRVHRPDGSVLHVSARTSSKPGGDLVKVAVREGGKVWSQLLDEVPDPGPLPLAGLGVPAADQHTHEQAQDVGAAGRVVTRPGRHGRPEQVRHDAEGNPVERVDAAGGVRRTERGIFDLVTATVDATGARTTYDYDTELRLVRVTNPLGLQWRYSYDVAGRLVEETDFDGRTLSFTYDAAGQLVRTVNGAEEVTEYRYDLLGNLVERSTPSGTTTYAHDPLGRLVVARSPESVLVLERDEGGRIVSQDTDGFTLSFTYDDADRVLHRLTPSGARSSWSFDVEGRPVSLVTAGHTVGLGHGTLGGENHRTVDGHPVALQAFDAFGALTAQLLPGRIRRLERRVDGELIACRDDVVGTTDYELDPEGRVLGVRTPDHEEAYSYDASGNLRSASTGASPQVELTYEGTRVVESRRSSHRYDAQGRTVARTPGDVAGQAPSCQHLVWNGHDQLSEVVTADGDRWNYRYDPLGRRVAKERLAPGEPGVVIEHVDFVWDGSVLVEQLHTDVSGQRRVTTWEHHPSTRYPLTQFDHDGGGLELGLFSSVITGPVGTVTDLLAPDGTLRSVATSLWGALRAVPGAGLTPLGFPGQHRDAETGLHYNLHRYYDPATARYLSQDPLGLAAAPSPVAYVDNPLSAADPLGLAPSPACSIGVGGVPSRPGSPAASGPSGSGRPGTASRDPLDAHPGSDITDAPRWNAVKDPPPVVFHGSSAPPDIVMTQGLKSSSTLAGRPPNWDLRAHVHNPRDSGFVSTSGNISAAMQFVRGDPLRTVREGARTFQYHEGFIYTIKPTTEMIHVPTQNLKDLERFRFQDEWAHVGDIPASQIIDVRKIVGYYTSEADLGRGAMKTNVPQGLSLQSQGVSGWSTLGAL